MSTVHARKKKTLKREEIGKGTESDAFCIGVFCTCVLLPVNTMNMVPVVQNEHLFGRPKVNGMDVSSFQHAFV